MNPGRSKNLLKEFLPEENLVFMYIKFWGTRGSIASPGPDTVKFGGNTACVEVVSNTGKRVVIDAGTGIRGLGDELVANRTAGATHPVNNARPLGSYFGYGIF